MSLLDIDMKKSKDKSLAFFHIYSEIKVYKIKLACNENVTRIIRRWLVLKL